MNFSLKAYVKTLIPVFNKRDFINDIANVKQSLQDGIVRNWELASGLFQGGLKSPEVRAMNDKFEKKFARKNYRNMIDGIHSILSIMEMNCSAIEKIALRQIQGDISSSAISYLKANLIRYVELMDFSTRYANGLLAIVLYYEAKKNNLRTQNQPTKRDFAYIEKNFVHFIAAMEVMAVNAAELEKALSSVPDVTIPEDDSASNVIEANMGNAGDPLNMRFIFDTATFNLPFHLNNLWNNYLQTRYDKDVEMRKTIELKIEDYRRSMEGNPDPKTQAIIEAYEKRAALLDSRLKAEEEKYAHA